MKRGAVGVTYTNDSPAEITLGVCNHCNNYVPFIRIPDDTKRVYQCLSCKHRFQQLINGKVVFKHLDEIYKMI
tara:strand:+ start:10 stop:228 length:219 start_codon:yes stop_codon:yes gene_type:complete